ncbi:branched-chain amino acid transporter permease [Sinanaerobacter sp. ZZT-01]|uniref:branched-chain amino acid transporter permease n=1 Tax=Sinanaerobacter sp. ZZT-01 TaxID=3111540 RepID=UPI002D76E2F1|nr:AzlD domain-containing protein [Sinanaerobacter sp. ZZT-01]WRR92467.1 AzlD domain-containing protein [Sinanaerobacter sp. ZZT-01]
MTVSPGYAFVMVAVMAAVMLGQRATPFVLFKKGTPKSIDYIGQALPPAVMAMLIIYSLKAVSLSSFPHGLPELIALAFISIVHIWKHNNLISILGGTILYMILIQVVFV